MTPELIGIITVGVALAGLILRISTRLDKLEQRLAQVEQRLSHLEGLIEGLFRPRPVMPPSPDPDQHDEAA